MFKVLASTLLLSTIVLAGCSSLGCGDPHPYLNSPGVAPLKAPAGLTIPAADPAYAVGKVTPAAGKGGDRDAAGVCLINPPNVLPVVNTSKPATGAPAAASRGSPSSGVPAPAKPEAKDKSSAPAAGTAAAVGESLAVGGGTQ